MKRILAFSLLALASSAFAQTFGIASGQATGTNYPMAEDIKRVCSTAQHPINNVVSDGSLDNIFKIYGDPTVQFGIIQADALEYQKGLDPKMMSRIQMVFPFFSTEIHLVAKDGSPITMLAQLAGKNVVEGPEGSGTWVTVQIIKKLTGLKWNAFYASQGDGMKAVVNGQADAEFIVAGAPVSLIKQTPGIKLVSLSNQALDGFALYTKTMIPTSTYPGIKTSTSTYKVDNVLATFAFKSERQAEIGGLVTCIAHNITQLQQTGHPKWRDVDPTDIDRIKWPAHPAAVAAIKRELKH